MIQHLIITHKGGISNVTETSPLIHFKAIHYWIAFLFTKKTLDSQRLLKLFKFDLPVVFVFTFGKFNPNCILG